VREHEIERSIPERKLGAVGFHDRRGQPLLRHVRRSEPRRAVSHVDSDAACSAAREPREIDARTAANVEHPPIALPIEIDQPQEMMQFFEVILIQIREETGRARRVLRNLEIVNVLVPVRANARRRTVGRRHDAVIYVE
jgi:hypothetical protein